MFKEGDKVKLIRPDSLDKLNGLKKGDVFTVIEIDDGDGSYEVCTKEGFWFYENQLQLIGDAMKYKVNDILIDENGGKFKVLEALTNIYIISHYSSYERSGSWYTQKELDIAGFELYTEDKPKEMTVAEISEKLGYEVKVVK